MKHKFIITGFLFLISVQTFALPRFALRYKDNCSDCHVNPTGGIVRNVSGWYAGKNIISMISPRDKDFKATPKLTENIIYGADFRTQYLYSSAKDRTDFQDMAASVYTNVKLSSKIDLVARYDFAQIIWEGYGIARILPNESYIKAGTFQPYFGLRIDDHTAYTRGGDFNLLFSSGTKQGLIYNPFYRETGIELGINITDYAMLTASAGRSSFSQILANEPTYTGRFELNPNFGDIGIMIGGSYVSAKTPLNSSIYGGFAGIGTDRLTFMGEYDIGKDYIAEGNESSYMMLKAAYQVMLGIEAVVRYDRFDPNTSVSSDDIAHVILGAELFPYSFIEIRPQYRFNLEKPEKDNDAVVVQFHFWY